MPIIGSPYPLLGLSSDVAHIPLMELGGAPQPHGKNVLAPPSEASVRRSVARKWLNLEIMRKTFFDASSRLHERAYPSASMWLGG